MKPEDLRLSCIHILIIPHAKLNQTHRKASSYESHLPWGYVVVVPNHRILQFCGKKSFFSLPFATFFSSLSRIAVVMVTLAKGDSGNEKWSQSAPQPCANHSLSVYPYLIWSCHVRKAYHNPRGETCCYNYLHGDLAVLPDACHSGEVFQKPGSNAGRNLETYTIFSLSQPISNKRLGFIWMGPSRFPHVRFSSCSNATGLFWGFWKRSTTPCFSGPARHFVVKDRKDHILNNLNWQKDMASMVFWICQKLKMHNFSRPHQGATFQKSRGCPSHLASWTPALAGPCERKAKWRKSMPGIGRRLNSSISMKKNMNKIRRYTIYNNNSISFKDL